MATWKEQVDKVFFHEIWRVVLVVSANDEGL